MAFVLLLVWHLVVSPRLSYKKGSGRHIILLNPARQQLQGNIARERMVAWMVALARLFLFRVKPLQPVKISRKRRKKRKKIVFGLGELER
jgi:hypothetical protein